ncbi:MAG: penicillin-binding protein 2 [Acidobacteriota bacterium]|nr:penicillin-binding protein 2 [Acidobacteriota bacterium]
MPIYQDNQELIQRMRWFRIIFVLAFIGLFAKLWSLTIVDFQFYKDLAERNRVRTISELAPRGLIYDRDGRVLVDNIYGFNLVLFRDVIQDSNETLDFLADDLKFDRDTLQERLEDSSSYGSDRTIVLKENLTMKETSYLLARQLEHPELGISKNPRRLYRYGSLAAHVTGYIGEVSKKQLEQDEFKDNEAGDIVGQFGIERSYDKVLEGDNGSRRFMVNSRGRVLQNLDYVEPGRGEELTLTIDLDLQVEAESQLGDKTGAVIAFDPNTGEILVMASRPTFDPNQFVQHITQQEWEQLLANHDAPLQNQTIQGIFAPGSTFKIIMGLAGLEKGIIDAKTSVDCVGSVDLYGNRFHCWKSDGHGHVTLREAIQHSCNVYFYSLGQKLSLEEITSFARRLGLGNAMGIELGGEVLGLIPSEEWKRKTWGEPWYVGETISLAIGQGPLLVTPAQMARAVGIIATGNVPQLHLVKGEAPKATEKTLLPTPDFSAENLEVIRDAMWSAVNEGGTGQAAQIVDFEVAGKTGTAQTISLATREKLSDKDAEPFQPNAWFVGFAPRKDPEIVVAVIVQRGGSGDSGAAPIAREILRVYYEKHKKSKPDSMELVFQIKRKQRS